MRGHNYCITLSKKESSHEVIEALDLTANYSKKWSFFPRIVFGGVTRLYY